MVTLLLGRVTTSTSMVLREYCLRLHTQHCGSSSFIVVDACSAGTSPTTIRSNIIEAVRNIDQPEFILSSDRTFPIAAFDPEERWAQLKIEHLKRKGADTDAFVATMNTLLRLGHDIIDYECDIPQVMRRDRLLSIMELFPLNALVRTAYFGLSHRTPTRTSDPTISHWIWHMQPTGPVLVLEDTCFKHPHARRFLSKQGCSAGTSTH